MSTCNFYDWAGQYEMISPVVVRGIMQQKLFKEPSKCWRLYNDSNNPDLHYQNVSSTSACFLFELKIKCHCSFSFASFSHKWSINKFPASLFSLYFLKLISKPPPVFKWSRPVCEICNCQTPNAGMTVGWPYKTCTKLPKCHWFIMIENMAAIQGRDYQLFWQW